jgi:XTP/dITP diphosphohydrolase
MELIFATNNAHKLEEIKAALPQMEIQGLKEAGVFEDIPETGNTLQENARIKARYLFDLKGVDCFADDTGLEVEALDGQPGVYSARYAGADCSFKNNNEKLLKELKGKPSRKAQFRTVICFIGQGQEYFFEGVCKGEILLDYQGEDGFGYDPIFRPSGFLESFAEMTMDQKNEISHRGLAVKKLIVHLQRV